MPEGHFELYFFLEVKQVYLTAQRPQQWAQRPSKQPTAHATKKLSVLVWARLLLLGLRNSFKRKKNRIRPVPALRLDGEPKGVCGDSLPQKRVWWHWGSIVNILT